MARILLNALNLPAAMKSPPSAQNLVKYPLLARTAKSYVLQPDAKNICKGMRELRWPTVVKFSGVTGGIDKARAEGGVTRRHIYTLYNAGLLAYGVEGVQTTENFEDEYPEGAASYRKHRHFERNGAVPNLAKMKRLRETGKLECDVCAFNFTERYGQLGKDFIEAHHTVPVSQMRAGQRTTLSSIVLVCSNCHRMLHRGKTLRTVRDLREAWRPVSGL